MRSRKGKTEKYKRAKDREVNGQGQEKGGRGDPAPNGASMPSVILIHPAVWPL